MPGCSFSNYCPPRKRWRYPGVAIPSRLDSVYWDYTKGDDPRARRWHSDAKK